MFKRDRKENKELTESELQQHAQKILQDKIQKANVEINKILKKYNLTMRINQNIILVPRQR